MPTQESFDPVQMCSRPLIGDALECCHDPDCYVCGRGRPCGLGVDFFTGPDGAATATWQPSTRFQGFPDRLHGGVLAALADGAMLHALLGAGLVGVTVDLNVRYLRAANLTEPLRVAGRVLSGRLGLYRCAATVEQGGNPILRATARFMTGTGAGLRAALPPEQPPPILLNRLTSA